MQCKEMGICGYDEQFFSELAFRNNNAPRNYGCYLAHFGRLESGDPMTPCSGRLVRVHLIPKQLLRREGYSGDMWDQRLWVWACGGFGYGNEGHHHAFDSSKKLRLRRADLPIRFEDWAHEHGFDWYLEREFGEAVIPSAA